MSTPERPVTRRTLLAAGGGVAVAAVAAACASDPAPAGPASAAAGGTGASPAPAASGSPTSGGAAGGSGPIAKVTDVPDGGSLIAAGVLLARTGQKVVGHSPICTHQGCTVAASGPQAHCPCHGSKYNAATGAVLHGPAAHPLAAIAVTVKDGGIFKG
ncbi:MAG: Rieske (2Fe-2S) protein [Actinomycetota bacterium]|nr:Rieske (2Fe-2S) protein [Actinomycetota bacterium]